MPRKPKYSFEPANWNSRRREAELNARTMKMGEQFSAAFDSINNIMDKSGLSFQTGVALVGLISNKAMQARGFTLEQTLVYNEEAIETFFKLDGSGALAPPPAADQQINKVPKEIIGTLRDLIQHEKEQEKATEPSSVLKRYTEFNCAIMASWFIHEFKAETAEQLIDILAPFVHTAKVEEPSFNVEAFKSNICQSLVRGRFGKEPKFAEALIVATLPL